jgi:glycosyltransferase involved in cell wall biosynthesis
VQIGIVTACYKPVVNGVTQVVSLYKKHLEARGHDVALFTLGEPDPAGDEPNVIRSPAIPVGDTGYYITPRYSRAAQRRLHEMDIIHCHHLFMGLEMAHRYGRCPIVYTNHTRYDLYTGAYVPLPQPAADVLMRQIWPDYTDLCDVVVTPSEGLRRVMLDFGVRQPIRLIENGVELDRFRAASDPSVRSQLGIPDDAILAIYVGRLSAEKNIENLLNHFALAHEMVSRLRLVIAGGGPQRELLAQRATELGVGPVVHFVGPLPYDQVAGYLAAADFFVTASVSEVHPLTVIEAMASGLPVAAIASPGIADTVEHGATGMVTSAEAGLSAAMVAMAADPARLRLMGQTARRASQRYDIQAMMDKTLALYDEMRQLRPDLRRRNRHGRWRRTWERMRPMVEQLARMVNLPDDTRGGHGRRS